MSKQKMMQQHVKMEGDFNGMLLGSAYGTCTGVVESRELWRSVGFQLSWCMTGASALEPFVGGDGVWMIESSGAPLLQRGCQI